MKASLSLSLIGFGARQEWTGRMALIAAGILYVVLIVLMGTVWKMAFSAGRINGSVPFNLTQMILYLVFAEALIVGLASPYKHIEAAWHNGTIAARQHYPVDYMTGEVLSYSGVFLVRLACYLSVGMLLGLLMAHEMQLADIMRALLILPVAACGFLIYLLWQIMIGVSCMWLGSGRAIHMVLSKVIFIFGLFPIDVYPAVFQKIALFMPFTAVLYLPVSLIYHHEPATVALHIGLVLFWLSLSVLAFRAMSRAVNRKIMLQED